MQNSFTERRSYADSNGSTGNLDGARELPNKLYYTSKEYTEQSPVFSSTKRKPSAFTGAAGIVLKTGIFVLSIIGHGIKHAVGLLVRRPRHNQYDARPDENEL
jgi:hypothetical protein